MLSEKEFPRYIILVGLLFFSKTCTAANVTRHENELHKMLFRDYNKETRPVLNQSDAIVAQFGIGLKEILDLDERNQILTTNVWVRQTWKDPLLVWNASHYGGLNSINISPDLVWRPDIVLYNNVNNEDHGEQYLFNTKVIVYSNGNVEWFSPNILKTNCKIDIKYFPFDTQICKVTFGSWTFNGFKLDLQFFRGMAKADIGQFSTNGEWELVSADAVRNVVKYGCCPEPYPDLSFSFKMKRRSLFYVNNLIMPCIVLALLTGLSFLFPPETGERISLVVTVLLGMTVFMIIFTEAIPSTSEATPLIGKYFAAVLFEISLCLVATCVPLRLHHMHPGTQIPKWARVLIFDIFGRIFCYNCNYKSKSSVDAMEQNNVNKQMKLSENDIIENGYLDDYNGDGHGRNRIEKSNGISFSPSRQFHEEKPQEVSVLLKHFERMEMEDKLKAEWKDAICILDRMFFWVFVFTFLISSLVILLGPTT